MTKNKLERQEIINLHRGIFKRTGDKYRVCFPIEMIDYLKEQEKSNTWKGKVLLVYMGVYMAYQEAYNTYRKRSLNIYNIMEMMGVSPDNREISALFSKKGIFSEMKYITHVNDLPHSYSCERIDGKLKMTYNTAKGMSESERKEAFVDFENRQMRAIEPTINIHGVTRKRGRGVEVIREPLDRARKGTISFSYGTIHGFVSGRVSANDLWALAMLKRMVKNANIEYKDGFRVTKKRLGKLIGVSAHSYSKIHSNLTQYIGSRYGLKQVTSKNSEGQFSSAVYLKLDKDI